MTDAVHLAESRLDLAELHTLAVELDLMILAAKALDRTVGVVSHQVTSLVDSVCGRGGEGFGPARVVNELGVCLLGVVQVLSGQSAAGKGQFANRSDGCQAVVVIGINDPGAGRLDAVSDASRLAAWRDLGQGSKDGGLGGAISVDHLDMRCPLVDDLS